MQSGDVREGPLETIDFLARSSNRVCVLDALTDGPVERYDLEESTGVSRATLGRILDDFAERGWVSETDREYEATQLGEYVSREFAAVMGRFDPVPELGDVVEWFPEGGYDFDLGRLAGATVVRPTRNNALAPTAHIAERLRHAERARLITYSVLPDVVEACWAGAVHGGLELVSVLETGAIETVGTDAQVVERYQEIFETGRSEVYLYDGDVPATAFVVDDVVLLCLSGGEGAPRAVIETEDETIRAWADETIDEHRREGTRLDPSMFTG